MLANFKLITLKINSKQREKKSVVWSTVGIWEMILYYTKLEHQVAALCSYDYLESWIDFLGDLSGMGWVGVWHWGGCSAGRVLEMKV